MDQNRKQGMKRERHSKEDKKQYRKRRKLRKNLKEKEISLVKEVAPALIEPQAVQRVAPCSRAHTIVNMAVTPAKHRRSTFLTPNLRSALLPSRKRAYVAHHQPKTTAPELDRALLSLINAQEIVLGEGTYGVTRLMYFNENFPVAVKEFKMSNIYEVKKEAGVISELQQHHHANLPYVLGVCLKEKPYLMITQFYGKVNKSFPLNKAVYRGIIEFDDVGKVFKQIVDAIHFVHESGWLHNDIKENNVLMHRASKKWKPIVIDFGKCRLSSNPKRYDLSDVQKALYRRKHSWIAPELIQGTHSQSPASDVYSLGVLLQNMLSKFVQQSYCLESLATRCLARYPDSRITLSKLKKEL